MDFMHRYKSHILSLVLLIVFLLFFIPFFVSTHGELFNDHTEQEINYLIFLATIVLGIIAYQEFQRSHQLTCNEFLLFISDRWGSKEIIEARQVLHVLFVDAYRDENGKSKNYNEALCTVSGKVLEMSKKRRKKEIGLFCCLIY